MKFVRSLIPQTWVEWLVYAAAAILTILKLTRVLDWSWLWILAPIWISFGIVVLLGFMTALGIGVPMLRAMRKDKGNAKKSLKQ